jgi:hypothetical protein
MLIYLIINYFWLFHCNLLLAILSYFVAKYLKLLYANYYMLFYFRQLYFIFGYLKLLYFKIK